MASLITWAYLGDEPVDLPKEGETLPMSLAPPSISAIYRARNVGIKHVRTPYLCWLDGGGDRLLPAHAEWWPRAIERLEETGAHIAYAEEMHYGVPIDPVGPWSMEQQLRRPHMLHHAVICRVSSLREINWPEGCFHWERLAYGALARRGFDYSPDVVYDWRPEPHSGARLLPDTARGTMNALSWLQGRPGVHFPSDLA